MNYAEKMLADAIFFFFFLLILYPNFFLNFDLVYISRVRALYVFNKTVTFQNEVRELHRSALAELQLRCQVLAYTAYLQG